MVLPCNGGGAFTGGAASNSQFSGDLLLGIDMPWAAVGHISLAFE